MTPAPGKTTEAGVETFFIVDLTLLTVLACSDVTLSTLTAAFSDFATEERVAIWKFLLTGVLAWDNKG